MVFSTKWLRMLAWLSATFLSVLCLINAFIVESHPLWSCVIAFCFFNAYLEFLVSALFISPGLPKPSFQSDEWISHHLQFDTKTTHVQLFQQEQTAPLIVFIHGWRGSSASVLDRAQWFVDKGWHAAIMELPGHGSSSSLTRWNAISASKHIQYHLQNFESILEPNYVSNFFLYGHSMGGYLCTRISKDPKNIPYELPLSGVILESPLLLYSKILLEISDKLKIPHFIRPLHLKRVFREVNLMHPEINDSLGLDQFDVPLWGVPSAPTICLQSMNDNRLGRSHYDAAVSEFTDNVPFTHHLIESLTHSGAQSNHEREEHLREWLNTFDSLLLE